MDLADLPPHPLLRTGAYACFGGPLHGSALVVNDHMIPGESITLGFGSKRDPHRYIACCDENRRIVLVHEFWPHSAPDA